MNDNIVVIDANFILLPFQFKIDFLNEIKQKLPGKITFIIFKQVIDELKAKEEREYKANKFSKLFNSGLLYLEKNEADYDILYNPVIKTKNETSDDFLLRNCRELKINGKMVYLATNDSELKKRAKQNKINIIYVRQKKFISIERP